MKKVIVLLLSVVVVFGLYATVYAQGAGGPQGPGVANVPGIPIVTGKETAPFEAASQGDAQGICDQVATAYKFSGCTATRSTESTESVPKLWYCVCK